jgi:hypothetical protein
MPEEKVKKVPIAKLPNQEKLEKGKDNQKVRTAESKEDAMKLISEDKTTKMTDVSRQIATRDLLERDFKEGILRIPFKTSSDTNRVIKAYRPNQKQMIIMMKLTAEAMLYDNTSDPKNLSKMVNIYEQLPKLAEELSVDKKFNQTFWETAPVDVLMGFVMAVMAISQTGGLESSELDSFR